VRVGGRHLALPLEQTQLPLALSACGLAVFAAAWVAGNRPDSAILAASARS